MNLHRLLALPFLAGTTLLTAADQNPSRKIDFNLVGDILAPAYTAPTSTTPAYYILHEGGVLEQGDPVANDPAPPASDLTRALAQSLPGSNFLPATADHAPSLLLVAHWGVMREDSTEIIPPFDIPRSLRARLQLIAPPATANRIERKLTDRLHARTLNQNFPWPSMLSNADENTLDLARDDLYFVVVTAYDYAAAAKNETVPVWRLKLSTPARRLSMADALPALIRHARDHFGRATPEPINEKRSLYPAPVVRLEDRATHDGPAPAATPAPTEPTAAALTAILQVEQNALSGAKIVPVADARPALPRALQQRLDAYRAQKLALQHELKAQLDQATPGTDTARQVEAFNQQHADRIATLNREREAIRSELAQLAASDSPSRSGKSLQALLDEFAASRY